MTRDEIVNRILSYGFDYLVTATELVPVVDEACREFDNEENWPWRIVEASGAEPLTVTRRGPVQSVRNAAGAVIEPIEVDELVQAGKVLSTTGVALYYFIEDQQIRTYPRSATNITVRHWARGGWTTGNETAASGADSPKAPVRWHDAILTLALLRVKMHDDDYDEAAQLWQRYQSQLDEARRAELGKVMAPKAGK